MSLIVLIPIVSKVYNIFVFIVILLLMCEIEAFNLEDRVPIIKLGHKGSYFGFSVAEHRTIKSDGAKESWLLVGAPLDQNLQPNVNRSGALWKCGLTMSLDDCIQVPTDGRRAPDSNKLLPPQLDEIKNSQWLGVTVKSQGTGGKVLVCAHRYVRLKGESHQGQGLCYILDNSLNYDDSWEPCKGRVVHREHEEYGYCQVGTSSSFLDDGTILLGSPGPYTWRGAIFVMDTNDDFLKRDMNIYTIKLSHGTNLMDKYSYLGMSVTGGRYFGPEMSYATGASRSNGTGQVVIFTKNKVPFLDHKMIINGEQFASSFGYEIATADLNGDRKPDLIVGAPFYFTRNAGGAVYIYLNKMYSFDNTQYSIKLTGKVESRFGFALANAGDLNKDGCDDLAIGSPYENSGVVYIYLGHRQNGLIMEPKQIIRGDYLPVKFNTFGYSLSGGIDMDDNGYPDLLVGAYEKDGIALLRARPIIDIETSISRPETLKNIDPSKHGCSLDPYSNHTCFSFNICCLVEELKRSPNMDQLTLNYVVEAETFVGAKKFSRIYFEKDQNVLRKNISLSKSSYSLCREHVVYVKDHTKDIQTPIMVNYSISQGDPYWNKDGPLFPIDQLPILNATQAVLTFQGTFLRDCGSDDVCESDLVIKASLELPTETNGYVLTLGEKEEFSLYITVGNEREPAYESQLFISHHRSLDYIAMEKSIDKQVSCKVYNETLIACSLGNPYKKNLTNASPVILRFDPKLLEDNELSINFVIWANSTSKAIDPDKKPTIVRARIIKNAELTIKGSSRPDNVYYGGEVKGESAMKTMDDVGSKITHIYQVFNLGPWRVNSVDVTIDWPHQIANNKEAGKWLFYLESISIEEGEGSCRDYGSINPLRLKSNPEVKSFEKNLNKNKIEVKNQSGGNTYNLVRKRRDEEMVVKPEAFIDKEGARREVVNMNCMDKTAKCIKIVCNILKLGRNQEATIKIQSRLWNSSLVEDYPSVHYVAISSRAKISVDKSLNIFQNNSDDDVAIVSTLAYPQVVIIGPENFMWWIILAIIVGILVLIGLILLLWKLGFFRRKKLDVTLSGNLEKREDSPFLGKSNR